MNIYVIVTTYSACTEVCEGDNCNTGEWTKLGAALSEVDNVSTCHHCSFIERDDGSTDGSEECRDVADAPRSCPSYARVSL